MGKKQLSFHQRAEKLKAAAAEMAGHLGGLVLLELEPGAGTPQAVIRALVSEPAYNPNALAEQFET
ncbi:MAG TPA: hypothetical protein P5169_07530, partial [Kiritimatiellia bacterium]|nr:hypothetical protein [Kiritimatiellia bacterium]